MPTMTKEARETLDELLEEVEEIGPFEFLSEYENQGICFQCGSTQHGVEPDAQEYTCETCGKASVTGLEMAILYAV